MEKVLRNQFWRNVKFGGDSVGHRKKFVSRRGVNVALGHHQEVVLSVLIVKQ